jgi:hypothetical protein
VNLTDALLDAVDGGRWVRVHRRTHRFFVWKAGDMVGVYSAETGEKLDDWPCADSAASAAAVVGERTNAGY